MPEWSESAAVSFACIRRDGSSATISRTLAGEVPVAIEVNGIGYAVMMATPAALEDFATGFVLAERLVRDGRQIVDIEPHPVEAGVLLRVTLAPDCTEALHMRVRHRASDSSCGICGIDSLEAALRPLPRVAAASEAGAGAVFDALDALNRHQPLNAKTGAMHAAALCAADGSIRMVREDVGRHNAFDKLIGAMARGAIGWNGGFALLSSRCSFELVEKAVLAGCPLLATISAPTALAVERARSAGLALAVVARSDSLLWLGREAP